MRREGDSASRAERVAGRFGLVLGFLMLVLLVAAICFVLALSLDPHSWWREGPGQWLIALAALGTVGGAAVVIAKKW